MLYWPEIPTCSNILYTPAVCLIRTGDRWVRQLKQIMPLVLTADEKALALEKGSSELKFLFEKNGVDNDLQAFLLHSQICTVAVFATIASSSDELKTLIKDEFAVDIAAGLQQRVRVANLLVCWEAAQCRTKRQSELEGELATKHLVKPMASSEYNAMRLAWESKFWAVEDEMVPARSYLERRAEDFEQEDYKAEPLTAVINKDQDDNETLTPVWSSSGALQMKKSSQSIEEPKNAEQLRKRIKILSMGLMFLGLRHSNRAFLQDLNPQIFEDYVCYLLSEHCFLMTGKSAEGFSISGPSWAQLLLYEFQVRKRAWQLVQNENQKFRDALKAAYRDPVVKERFLTTPVALTSSAQPKRSWDSSGSTAEQPATGKRAKANKKGGRGKGGGKGSGKGGRGGKGGKSATERLGIAARTPDGNAICFSYNDFNVRCKDKSCRFAHNCGLCFAKGHPAYACNQGNKAQASETQGGGRGSE